MISCFDWVQVGLGRFGKVWVVNWAGLRRFGEVWEGLGRFGVVL